MSRREGEKTEIKNAWGGGKEKRGRLEGGAWQKKIKSQHHPAHPKQVLIENLDGDIHVLLREGVRKRNKAKRKRALGIS